MYSLFESEFLLKCLSILAVWIELYHKPTNDINYVSTGLPWLADQEHSMGNTAIEVFHTESDSIASDKQLLDSNLKVHISIELQLIHQNKTHISILGGITVTELEPERNNVESIYFSPAYLEMDLSGNRNFTEIAFSVVSSTDTLKLVGMDVNKTQLSTSLTACYMSAKTHSCLKLLEIPRFHKEDDNYFIEGPPSVRYGHDSYILSENEIDIGYNSIDVTINYLKCFKYKSSLQPDSPKKESTGTGIDDVTLIHIALNVILLCFALCCTVYLCVTCQRKQQTRRNRLDAQQAPQRHLDAQPCVMEDNLQQSTIQPNLNVGSTREEFTRG